MSSNFAVIALGISAYVIIACVCLAIYLRRAQNNDRLRSRIRSLCNGAYALEICSRCESYKCDPDANTKDAKITKKCSRCWDKTRVEASAIARENQETLKAFAPSD